MVSTWYQLHPVTRSVSGPMPSGSNLVAVILLCLPAPFSRRPARHHNRDGARPMVDSNRGRVEFRRARRGLHRKMIDELIAGRYRLTERIAAGGMAEVHAAEDVVDGRKVALKILPPTDDAELVARF